MHQKYGCFLVLSKRKKDSEFVYGILPVYNDINLLCHETASWDLYFGHNIFD